MFLNFNTTAMTDQELLDKTTEIHKRLAYAQRFSTDGRLVEQLRAMAEACAFEAGERANRRLFDILNKNRSDENDLTPDSKTKTSKTNGNTAGTTVKKEGVFRTTRTSAPVKD